MVKNLPANTGAAGYSGSIPESGRSAKITWQPSPVFLPGEPHGQKSLADFSL